MVSSSPRQREDVDATSTATTAAIGKSHKSSVQKQQQPSPKPSKDGTLPLHQYRIYLDVKHHPTSAKLEARIKELGGVLELFLVREVTHVFTDREGWSSAASGKGAPATPQTPSNQSVQNDHHGTPSRISGRGRPKTRADAMLEKARKSTSVVTNDPLAQAKNWGITIWSIDKAFAWLDKVSASVASKQRRRQRAKVVHFREAFIKFEAFDRRHRPVFKEIRNWPTVNLRGRPGSTGILYKSHNGSTDKYDQSMTRKSRHQQNLQQQQQPLAKPQPQQPLKPGYCEVCRIEYARLDEHLDSKKHLAFIKDNANFIELDGLINDGTNIESFLTINGVKDGKVNVLDKTCLSPPFRGGSNNGKMPRTRTSSLCDKTAKSAALSPASSGEAGQRMRSRRPVSSYISNTAAAPDPDDVVPVKPEGARESRELRSSHRNALLKIAEQESDTWNSGRPKRACIKLKRTSVEERIIAESQAYYKIELSTKSKTSVIDNNENSVVSEKVQKVENSNKKSSNSEKEKALVVKFKRMRTSELRTLNNEAENFLFPKKDESSSEDDIDADRPDTTISSGRSALKDESTLLLTSDSEDSEDEEDNGDTESVGSNWSEERTRGGGTSTNCSGKKRRKKRLTHAQQFILDNKKYYKFETPGSRLRYQGSFMTTFPPVPAPKVSPTRSNGDVVLKKEPKKEVKKAIKEKAKSKRNTVKKDSAVEQESETKKESVDVGEKLLRLDELKFSFEQVAFSEPWYETFSRQDRGDEIYFCFSDSEVWKPLLLPYQLPPMVHGVDPKRCLKAFAQIRKQVLEEASSSGSNSATCSTPDPSNAPNLLDVQEQSKSSADDDVSEQTGTSKRRRPHHAEASGKNPRKSPRQHASTLAILSSYIQQRRKRELNRSKNSGGGAQNQGLDVIPEIVEESRPLTTYEALAKSVDEMLTNSFSDLKGIHQLDISPSSEIHLPPYKPNAIDILEDYENSKHIESKTGLAGRVKRCFAPGKRPGRKKKKNRTGWPNKNNKKLPKRAADSNSAGGACGSDEAPSNSIPDAKTSNSVHKNETAKTSNSVHKNETVYRSKSSNDSEVNVQSHGEDRVKRDRGATAADRWENAEKVLVAKVSNDANKAKQLQPYVRVTKMNHDKLKRVSSTRRLRSSSSPSRPPAKRAKTGRASASSPRSPRVLRRPRGQWYRER